MLTCRGRAHGAAIIVVCRGHEGRRARLRQAVPLADTHAGGRRPLSEGDVAQEQAVDTHVCCPACPGPSEQLRVHGAALAVHTACMLAQGTAWSQSWV